MTGPFRYTEDRGTLLLTAATVLMLLVCPILAATPALWPGLVGLLNLNASMTKFGVKYSTLWSERFDDDYFLTRLKTWLETGACSHDTSHVTPLANIKVSDDERRLGHDLADTLKRHGRL